MVNFISSAAGAVLAAMQAIGIGPTSPRLPLPTYSSAPAKSRGRSRWSHGDRSSAMGYRARRRFHAGRSSTLKKTAKLYRLLGGAY